MDKQTLTYDIVLLPDKALCDKATSLSQQLAAHYPTRFILDQQTVPHYSIYMAELDQTGVEEAKKALEKVAAEFAPFVLQATKYEQMPDGMFEIQYELTPELIQLQEKIIERVNPLREGRLLKEYPSGATADELLTQLTGNALEQLKLFGYPEIGEDYRPHMTFTRLQQAALQTKIDEMKLPSPEEFNGPFSLLGLFVMGKNGTCIQEKATFPFTH